MSTAELSNGKNRNMCQMTSLRCDRFSLFLRGRIGTESSSSGGESRQNDEVVSHAEMKRVRRCGHQLRDFEWFRCFHTKFSSKGFLLTFLRLRLWLPFPLTDPILMYIRSRNSDPEKKEIPAWKSTFLPTTSLFYPRPQAAFFSKEKLVNFSFKRIIRWRSFEQKPLRVITGIVYCLLRGCPSDQTV